MTRRAATRQAVRTCHICEVSCGLVLDLDEHDRVVAVRGDRDDVYSQGYICAKGAAIGDIDADPERLRLPLVRIDGELREVGWDEAFAEVDRLLAPLLAGDRSSVGLFTGNPSGHNFAGTLLQPSLERALGSHRKYSVSTIDQMPQMLAAGLMYGTPSSVPVADVDRTDHMMIVGGNPMVSNGSLGAGPRYPQRLKAVQDRGGTIVVIDPARTRTARAADRHVAIRPGTDVLLLLSMVRELFARGLVSLGAADGSVSGLDEVQRVVEPFASDEVEERCGVDAGTVAELTLGLATAARAVVYGRTGICLTEVGTLTSWAVQLLNVLTGNLDRPGGAMFTTPAVGSRTTLANTRRAAPIQPGTLRSRGRGAPDVLGEFPAACLAEDILTPGPDRVRGLITFAGNVARSVPSSDDVEAALRSLDALICIDPYLNETTRHAHVILPPAPPLTRSHFDITLYAYAVRNVANWSPPVYEVPDGALPEWDLLLRLIGVLEGRGAWADTTEIEARLADEMAARVGKQAGAASDVVLAMCDGTGADRLLDMRLRSGPYGDRFGARPGGLGLHRLRTEPHGIDFGALVPRLADVLAVSPTGRIELAPPMIVDDAPRAVAMLFEPPIHDALVMIGRRGVRSMNSSLRNIAGLGARERVALQVHPDDAARLGVADGALAEVSSARGRAVAPVEVTDEVRPGVCSLPHGFGRDWADTAMTVAAGNPGANANALTDDRRLDPLSGTAALYATPVTLRPLDAPTQTHGGTQHDRTVM